MTAHRRRGWVGSLALGMVVSLFFLYLTLRKVAWGDVAGALAGVSLPILSLALITKGMTFLAMGLRSRGTVAPGGTVPLKELVLSHLLGYTGNNILPFRLGELLRVEYLARRHALSRSFLVGTVAIERLLDTATLLAIFGLVVPAVFGRRALSGNFLLLAGATVALLVVVVVAARWRRLPDVVGKVLRPLSAGLAELVGKQTQKVSLGLSSLSDGRWAPRIVAGTVLYWLLALGSMAIIMTAFGLDLPLWAPLLVVAVTALGTALPTSPGAVGTYHYFSALALSLLGVDRATTISFAIVAHGMAFVPYTLVGLVVFSTSLPVWARRAMAQDAVETDPSNQE